MQRRQHAVQVGLAVCCFTTRTQAALDRAVCATVLAAGATMSDGLGGVLVAVVGGW